jgi:MFS family permease
MFRALWIAQFASNVGTWMQTVGAQWLLIDSSPLLVSLVQTASSLPIVLLALPAGAWADLVDRRRLLLGAQLAMFTAATALAVGTFLGITSPAWVLLLTFVLGCGNAVAAPAWQAIQPDLVERSLLPQAAALNGLNMNVARAVGPAIGGLVVAWVGAGWVFALNAISFVGIAAVIGMWRPPERAATGPRERLVEALRSGGRYVRNALIVRRLLYRAILFIPAASAVWALLPVLAAGNLGLGSAGYGLLLGMVGIGAVAGAFLIPRVRARIGSARLVTGAMVVTAVALAVIAASSNPLVVGVALLPVGSAWIAVMSSLNSGLQLTLPNWVRARGLAYYLVVFQGAQALGGVLWGVVADATDGPRGPLPQAYGRPAVGAVPRRRRSHPVRRVLPRRHLGRARAAAREQAHRCRPPVRGAGSPLHRRRAGGRPPLPAVAIGGGRCINGIRDRSSSLSVMSVPRRPGCPVTSARSGRAPSSCPPTATPTSRSSSPHRASMPSGKPSSCTGRATRVTRSTGRPELACPSTARRCSSSPSRTRRTTRSTKSSTRRSSDPPATS